MKDIVVLVHDDAGQEARLQVALDLTRALGGHLTCVDVADLMIMGESSIGGALVVEDTRAEERINRARIEQRLAIEALPWTWVDQAGADQAAFLASASLCADLIVVGGMADSASHSVRRLVTKLLSKSHSLIVAASRDGSGLDLQGAALVAWDGSGPAASALQRAVPLLALASAVAILEVGLTAEDFTGEQAATYLSRHGVHASVHRVPQVVDFADTILAQAKKLRAAYCVMGAYKNPPLSEAIFGGVTRTLLAQSDLTLFLGH
jgi:nucleotide-binding universal stress UspA family protein